MTMTRVMALLCGTLMVSGCTDTTAVQTVTVRLTVATSMVRTVSTLATIRLEVDEGSVTPSEYPIGTGETTPPFTVKVPEGEVEFRARLFSNNGVELYRAVQVENITDDDFSLTLTPIPIHASMKVFPDSIDLEAPNGANFIVSNAGRDSTLSWSLTPPCDANGCITVSRTSGTLLPGANEVIVVSGFAVGARRTSSMRIASNVGHIDVYAITPADLAAPVLTVDGIPNGSTNPIAARWTLTAVDTGRSASGLAAPPFRVRLRRVRPALQTCYAPDNTFTGNTTPCLAGNVTNLVSDDGVIAIDAARTGDGYWELIGTAQDRAGNISQSLTTVSLVDFALPSVVAVNIPSSLAGNGTHNVVATITDNVDLLSRRAGIGYAGGFNIHAGVRTIGNWGIGDGLAAAVADTIVLAGYIRAWEGTDPRTNRANGNVSEAQTLTLNVRDVALNASQSTYNINAATRAGAGGAIASLDSIAPSVFAPQNQAHGQFVHGAPSPAAVCRTALNCVGPSATLLSATFIGPAASPNPFTRVEFYYFDSSAGRWVRIGQASASVIEGPFDRTWRYTLAWNVAGITLLEGGPLLGNVPVIAVGIHTSGSALITTGAPRTVAIAGN